MYSRFDGKVLFFLVSVILSFRSLATSGVAFRLPQGGIAEREQTEKKAETWRSGSKTEAKDLARGTLEVVRGAQDDKPSPQMPDLSQGFSLLVEAHQAGRMRPAQREKKERGKVGRGRLSHAPSSLFGAGCG